MVVEESIKPTVVSSVSAHNHYDDHQLDQCKAPVP